MDFVTFGVSNVFLIGGGGAESLGVWGSLGYLISEAGLHASYCTVFSLVWPCLHMLCESNDFCVCEKVLKATEEGLKYFGGRFSGVAPANQTKERSVHKLFAGAFRNKSSMWIVLVFLRKNTRIHKKGEIHELFVFPLSLVWFAGATPEFRGILRFVLTILRFRITLRTGCITLLIQINQKVNVQVIFSVRTSEKSSRP